MKIPTITLHLTLQTLPSIMRRSRHVLVLVQNQEGKYVLGKKTFFPENIFRMVGGGLDQNEDPQIGAARELAEELHIVVSPQEFVPLAEVKAEISHGREHLSFTTWLFFYQLTSAQSLQPDDDLDGVVELTQIQVTELIQRYSQLQNHFNSKGAFSWADYGALYGPIHQIALEKSLDLLPKS